MGKCVIIVGMHRAGTSLCAKMFYKWGIISDTDIMGGDGANTDGFYESREISVHNERLLKDIGKGGWNYPTILPAVHDADIQDLVKRYRKELWGFKDNRMAFTFRIWEQYLKDEDILFVVCRRDKFAVIRSLFRTHAPQFQLKDRNVEYFAKLYDMYYDAINQMVEGYPTISVRYEDMQNFTFFNEGMKHF